MSDFLAAALQLTSTTDPEINFAAAEEQIDLAARRGAELIALITEQCFDDLDARPMRLSSQDIPTPYNGSLENLTIIQPHQIVEAAQALVNKDI